MLRHLLQQTDVIAALARTALSRPGTDAPETPSPEIVKIIRPRPADLVRDYVREVGGDPRSYRDRLPPHLFPQWGFPLATRALRGVPYPLTRALNGGCRLEIHGALPAGVPLRVAARLDSIDDDGRRAVLVQRVATGVDGDPELVVAYLYAVVPRKNSEGNKSENGKPRATVDRDADEIAYWRLTPSAGVHFALLTGDVNPIHWSRRYARAFGFRRTILHGFATMARAYEGLVRNRLAGDTAAIQTFDVKFTRPLVLPSDVGLYLEGDGRVAVGAAPGGPAYMKGSYETA